MGNRFKFLNIIKEYLSPDMVYSSVYEIDYDILISKGIKNILFDVDNTLVDRFSYNPEWKIKKLLRELKEKKMNVYLVTNTSKLKRIIRISSFLEQSVFMKSFKPFPWIYKKLKLKYSLKESDTVCVGDQLFTDILGAKLNNYLSIYVYPMGKEISFIRRMYIAFEQLILSRFILASKY
ncbi:MAG: hypothetical protein A2Y40_06050 [Candidatus Margulisbacteria bacterium GWF2_35_9]|nr:MAG: hypothetical protein A2Y40_06050 [Candidatus Margulisbacteria bacterium GWF2_35_9]